MKALISPNEGNTVIWVTSWNQDGEDWVPNTTESIDGCQRVAEVEPDNEVFEVASPLYWVDCPDDCLADKWYFKDGQVKPKPQNAPIPGE